MTDNKTISWGVKAHHNYCEAVILKNEPSNVTVRLRKNNVAVEVRLHYKDDTRANARYKTFNFIQAYVEGICPDLGTTQIYDVTDMLLYIARYGQYILEQLKMGM